MQKSYFIEDIVKGKEVVIDWFQVSFDFIPIVYEESINSFLLEKNGKKFRQLIELINPKSDLIQEDYATYISDTIEQLTTKDSGRFRFKNGYMLGENIELSFGGNKTALGSYPAIFIMTGQGCREFETRGGDWIELFKYFLKESATGYFKIGRFDVAIDDFDGKEITPYEIEKHIRAHNYTSPFRKVNYNITEMHSNQPETIGFAITFGSRGSSQLQIYDKNLERRSNKEVDKNTAVWYRYEMRFMDEMAYTVLTKYIEAFDLNDSIDFMDYMKGVLKSLLDIKVYNPNNAQKTRWKTLPEWDDFLDSLSKVDIRRRTLPETTIDKKVDWFASDMATTLLQFALVYDGDNFAEYINEVVSSADFKAKHLKVVNNYFEANDESLITLDQANQVKSDFKLNLNQNVKPEKELLDDLLIKLDSHIEDFIFSGDPEEKDVCYINKVPFLITLVDGNSRFHDFKNILYIGRSDFNRFIFVKNMIEFRIKELKGFL